MIPFVKTFYENNKSSEIYDALNENKYSLQFMIKNCSKNCMVYSPPILLRCIY
jgi:hypothetical protein